MPFSSEAKVDRLLAIPSPPPSPLTSYSSPLPQILSPPLPVSSPLPISPPPPPASLTHLLGYKAAMIRLRAESPSTSHPLPLPPPIVLPRTRASMAMMRAAAPSTYYLSPPSGTPPILPIPLPTSSPPLLLPSTDCRADVPKVTLSPRKRLCIAPGPRYKIRETLSAPTARYTGGFRADYGFVGTLDAKIGRGLDREIGYGITDVWVDPDEIDIDEIYVRLDDAQDDRLLMSGQLNLLRRDRRSYARTTRLMESEARASCKAWKMPPRKAPKTITTRSSPTTTTTTTTPVTDAQLKTLIAQGVTDVLAECDATRSRNCENNHDSGTGVRRQDPLARE
ncbi:hypothetical protein Tco_0609968 [Tanacetum coccineum]